VRRVIGNDAAQFSVEAQPKSYLLAFEVRWHKSLIQQCFQAITAAAIYNSSRIARKGLMTLQEIQNQALQLPTGDRWQLVQVLLDSLKREANLKAKQRNLSRLRGVAKISAATGASNAQVDYVTYLTEKYQ
jgi:hypothetical protein